MDSKLKLTTSDVWASHFKKSFTTNLNKFKKEQSTELKDSITFLWK